MITANDPGAYGGPVVFVLLINHLLKNSRELLNDLWEFMKNLKVIDYKNEDVHTMVYALCVNFERIHRCVDAGTYCMRTDFLNHLIQVFQSLSCKKFNGTFVKLETDLLVGTILKLNANHTGPKITWTGVLTMASETYKLYEKDLVTQVQEQGPRNHGFDGQEKKKGPCHGCGGPHWLCECPNKQCNQKSKWKSEVQSEQCFS